MQKYNVDALKLDGRYSWMKVMPLLAVLISSCSSNTAVLIPDRFDTEILDDGSKRFVFEVNFGRGGPEVGQEEGRGRNRNLSPQDMESGLEGYFELHPFCEEGYFVYDRGFNGSAYTMLGECQESAEVLAN